MRKASAQIRATMNKRRNFVNYAKMTLANGTVLNLEPKDFRINGNEFSDDTVDGEDFQVGTALGKTCTIRLDNTDDRFSEYDFYMAYFYLYVHLPDAYTDDDGVEHDGVFNIGKFTVIEPATTGTVIEMSAVDEMYKFDVSFDDCTLDFTQSPTLYTVLTRCCSDCGVAIGFTSFDNSTLRVSEKPNGVTYREVVTYICQIAGMNARISETGALRLFWYDMTVLDENLDGGTFSYPSATKYEDGDEADGGSFKPWNVGYIYDGGGFDTVEEFHDLYNIKSLSVSTDDIEFTGVRVKYEDADVLIGTSAYVLEVMDNPFTSGRENDVAVFLLNKLQGLKFRPFSCSHLQDPTIEAGDPALIWDRKGNIYKTIITNVTFSTSAFMSLSCNAKSPTKQGAAYRNPAAQAVVEARRNTKQQIDTYRSTIEHFTELANDALGYYKTEVVEDGATTTYLHDKPTIAASTNIVEINSAGIFISEDGGQSYASGYDVTTATAILNLVYAHGIVADWIESGIFRDKKGNFILDMDNSTLKLDLSSQVGSGTDATTLEAMLAQIHATAEGLTSEVTRAKDVEWGLNGTYSGVNVPTLNNYPAAGWTTQDDKIAHLRDIYIHTQTGNIYMFDVAQGGVTLTFDAQSATESPSFDYVRIYYYDSESGVYRYTKNFGGRGTNNTIAGLRIFVPSNTFWVYWHSDGSNVDWGFKIDSCEVDAQEKNVIKTSVYPNTASSLPMGVTNTLYGIGTMPETAHNYTNNENRLWLWNTQLSIPTGYYNWTLQTSMTAAYSQIKQTAEQISLKVSKGTLSSELSLETGQIRLNTTGRLVITSGNFKLDADGNMSCENATIHGQIVVGGSNNYNGGAITVMNSSNSEALLTLNNLGLTAYGADIYNYYRFRARYGINGSIKASTNKKTGVVTYRYNFNGVEFLSSYDGYASAFAYLGIHGNSTIAYPTLELKNLHANLIISTDDDSTSVIIGDFDTPYSSDGRSNKGPYLDIRNWIIGTVAFNKYARILTDTGSDGYHEGFCGSIPYRHYYNKKGSDYQMMKLHFYNGLCVGYSDFDDMHNMDRA